ncbi:hypothetical protein EON67_07775 [archaeon]|nr:MAG: hypothetical protein EON67_07775 [archaeon]
MCVTAYSPADPIMLRAALRALPLHCPVRARVGCTPALVRLASTGMNAHGVYDPNAEEEWTPRQDQATRMAAMSKAIDLRSDTGSCCACVRTHAHARGCDASGCGARSPSRTWHAGAWTPMCT